MRPLIILCFGLLLLTACNGGLSTLGRAGEKVKKTASVCVSGLPGEKASVVSDCDENEATEERNAHEVSTASLVNGWEMRISVW